MARTARQEGFDEIADWFETLAKAEKSHAGRFQRASTAWNNPGRRRRNWGARRQPLSRPFVLKH